MKMRVPLLAIIFFLTTIVNLHALGSPGSAIEKIAVFHPVITLEKGDVKVRASGSQDWIDASVGLLLLSGDELVTGKASQAEVEFASGTVHVYENSIIMVPSIGPDRQKKDIRNIFIHKGVGKFLINPKGMEEGFEFRTKSVQGSVRGTIFAVKVKETSTIVAVFEGIVEVSDAKGKSKKTLLLKKGEAINFSDDTGFESVSSITIEDMQNIIDTDDNLDLGTIENTDDKKSRKSKPVKDTDDDPDNDED